jgi:hypothetical protein
MYGISEKYYYMPMTLSLIIIITTTISLFFVSPVSGQQQQVSTNSNTKTWLDREHNIKILFSSIPVQPAIGTPSVLKFSVQNLETGKPVTNLLARVVILGGGGASNQEGAFRLTNISAPYGDFSINVIFPDKGSYQVITGITSQIHDIASLASFIVIVPAIQQQSTLLNIFGGSYIIWVIGLVIAAAAAGVASLLILKNTAMHKDRR